MATPGQPAAGWPPAGGVTVTRLSRTAASRPTTATVQPAMTSPVRLTGSTSPSRATANPTVTQIGGTPGPPGLSASSAVALSPCVVRLAVDRPASERKAAGLDSRCTDQGNSTKNGVTTTIAAFSGLTALSQRRAARVPRANTTPSTQVSG